MDLVFAPSQVESWPIARLRPYARNAKMHGDDQVAKIAASMAKFGWTVPCMVADDGELIAGHGRVLAATMRGFRATRAHVNTLIAASGETITARARWLVRNNGYAANAVDTFLTELGPRITGREISVEGLEIAAEDGDAAALPARASLFGDDLTNRQARNGSQPFAVVEGIAIIEIAGTLVHRGAWIGQSSGLTSYEGIAAQLQAALADPAIRGIALDIDSFGGEVAGAFDLADRIRAARAQKPVQAFVADHALSAAYALASQADRIILPRTGAVGSIGVVAMHSDMSRALDQIRRDKERVEREAFERLKAELTRAFAVPEESYRPLTAAEVIARNRG